MDPFVYCHVRKLTASDAEYNDSAQDVTPYALAKSERHMADRPSPAQPRRRATGSSISSRGGMGAAWASLLDGGRPHRSIDGRVSAYHRRVSLLPRG